MAALVCSAAPTTQCPLKARAAYSNGGADNVLTFWTDRPITQTSVDYAVLDTWVSAQGSYEGGFVLHATSLDGNDRTHRIGTVQLLLQVGQRDYPVTWSSPFPSADYSTDVGSAPLLGAGTAAVIAKTAGGCIVRVNVTTLVGLVNSFTVLAYL